MVYLNELQHQKFLIKSQNSNNINGNYPNSHYAGKLLFPPASGGQKADKRRPAFNLKSFLISFLKDCCDESSIHCVRYLTDEKLQKFEKLIWLAIIVATSVAATIVYFELSELYYTQRIQTTVKDSVHPVFFIPFPSIGICPANRINWPKIEEAQRRFLPPNASSDTLEVFQKFFERLDDFRFGTFGNQLEPIFEDDALVRRLHLIDGVSILDVMYFLAFKCGDMLDNCMWRRKAYNCCDLFTLERTELGYCHVFNSMVSAGAQRKAESNKFYPYHNSKSGEGSGLDVMVVVDKGKMRPGFKASNGVYTMVKQPQQWNNDVRFISSNTYTKIGVSAQLTETDPKTRAVTPVERQCFFEDENGHPMYKKIPGLLYWRGNCITRCHQEYIYKYCNCSVSLIFPKVEADHFAECRPSDFKCFYEHESIFSTDRHVFERDYLEDVSDDSMICNCLNSCNQLIFINYYASMPLELVNASDPVQRIHIDAHFQSNFILKYSTRMRFTFVELLANFGGIIGLFLGASLLSAVELGYFLTIGLYTHLQDSRRKSSSSSPSTTRSRTTNITVNEVKSANMTKAYGQPGQGTRAPLPVDTTMYGRRASRMRALTWATGGFGMARDKY